MASDTIIIDTLVNSFPDKNFDPIIFTNIFLAFGSALSTSKTAHYSREYIERCYPKDLKLMIKSGNKQYIKEIDRVWKFFLSQKLIMKHPTGGSMTYCFTNDGLKFFFVCFPNFLNKQFS